MPVMTTGVPIRRALTQRRRLTVLLVLLVLLVTLVGGVGLYFSAGPTTTLTGPTARVEANGLVLTLRVAPGPYFLRELLPVGVSLTNHTSATLPVEGNAFVNGCDGAFGVAEEGGGAPTYQLPTSGVMISCPGALTNLAPGQTMSATNLLPLTASGHPTLTAGVRVCAATSARNYICGRDPFAGHRPSLHLIVAAAPPLNRRVGLWRIGTRVFVIAPPPALSHLVYLYTAGAGGCATTNLTWQPIATPYVDEHPCAGRYGTWSYAVGAPGYAVASGTLSAS